MFINIKDIKIGVNHTEDFKSGIGTYRKGKKTIKLEDHEESGFSTMASLGTFEQESFYEICYGYDKSYIDSDVEAEYNGGRFRDWD